MNMNKMNMNKEKLKEAWKAIVDYKPDIGAMDSKTLKGIEKAYGETIAQSWKDNGGDGVPPFFSEVYLYGLMGKEDARTILALVRNLAIAGGLDRIDTRDL